MTNAALFVLPAVPEGEPEPVPAGREELDPLVIFAPTRLTRACTLVVLGGYALSVKIEHVSELLALKLQALGMM